MNGIVIDIVILLLSIYYRIFGKHKQFNGSKLFSTEGAHRAPWIIGKSEWYCAWRLLKVAAIHRTGKVWYEMPDGRIIH